MVPKQFQLALKQGGFDPGIIDGVWGPNTSAASEQWFKSGQDLPSVAIPPPTPNQGEPVWLDNARRYIGLHEIAGARNNPIILRWWTAIRAPFTNDETPWCAAFVGGILEESGIRSSRSAAARSYLNWGQKLASPAVGSIVVFERGPSTGHVAFVVGRDAVGNLMCLGGNQSNMVCIEPKPRSRVLGYRWPAGIKLPTNFVLPLVKSQSSGGSET